MKPTRVIGLLATAGALAAPAHASASELFNQTITASTAERVSCLEQRTGASVVRQNVTTNATGLVRAELRGDNGSDWDVSIFNRETGRRIAGSATTGSTELAEGVALAGTDLLVQACRRKGTADTVNLRIFDIALDEPKDMFLKLARVQQPNQHSRDVLSSLDLDDTHDGRAGRYMDVLLYGPEDVAKLDDSGLEYDIIAEDVLEATRLADSLAPQTREPEPLPSGRLTYRTYEEYGAEMKQLVEENPTLARSITLKFPSLEGRPVEGIEITKDIGDEATTKAKPTFFMTGVHHAREWPSGEMSMEWAFEAITKYKAENPRMQKLLENVRLVVVPLVNPDGFNLSRISTVDLGQPVVDPGFAYKRKNCRVKDFEMPKPGECGEQANRTLGVDPNRNYGGDWGGPGAAIDFADDTYRGPVPFSEPETQNLKEFISTNPTMTFITNHTYSDLILRPPAAEEDVDTPDETEYKKLSDTMAAENGYASLKSYELYDTSGSAEGWSYYATGGYGFTFEIGRASNAGDPVNAGSLVGVGFHPPYPMVVAEWNGKYGGGGNREAYYIAAEHAANTAHHSVIEGSGPAGATIRIAKEFLHLTKGGDPLDESPVRRTDILNYSTVIPASGSFTWHINQSTRPGAVMKGEKEVWNLTCEQGGKVIGKAQVSVDRGAKATLGNVCSGGAPGGSGGGGGGADASTLPASGKLVVSFAADSGKRTTARKKGMRVRVSCTVQCKAAASVKIDKKVAKALGLGRKALTIGKGSATITKAGRIPFYVKLNAKAKKALAKKKVKKFKLSVAIAVTDLSGKQAKRGTKRVSLR